MHRRRDEPVRLTRITRAGDSGQTSLGDGSRVAKDDPRVEAYGAVDELNATLGLVQASAAISADLRPLLEEIQNDLFDLGADLAVPLEDAKRERLRTSQERVEQLEELCDQINGELTPLKSFLLPGGDELAARLHLARTVCRRAERRVTTLAVGARVNAAARAYLNRLSDLLFILARAANARAGQTEQLWRPGLSQRGHDE